MISIKYNETLYGLSFCHPHLNGKGKKAPDRATICTINQWVDQVTSEVHIKGWRELSIAEVTCSRSDNFNRAVGRKKALARVLCQHDFGVGAPYIKSPSSKCYKCGSHRTATLALPKALRSEIWQAYWDATAPVFDQKEFVEGELIDNPFELPLEYSPGLGDTK